MKSSIKTTLCTLLLGLNLSVAGCVEHKEIAVRDQCQNAGISYGNLYATAWYRNWCEDKNYFIGLGKNRE